jgi:hypothetical protein
MTGRRVNFHLPPGGQISPAVDSFRVTGPVVRTRAPIEARVHGQLGGDKAEPPELLPPPGT